MPSSAQPPSLYLPKTEAHYLTVEGDVVDRIGYHYYGRQVGVPEALYRRNPWLTKLPPVLRAGIIIVLPVLGALDANDPTNSGPTNAQGTPLRKLWNYTEPKVWRGLTQVQTDVDAAEAKALAAYKASKALSPSAPVAVTKTDCCDEIKDPKEVTDFSYLATYYQAPTGEWKLGRIHKSNIRWSADGYGFVLATEDVLNGGLL